MESSSGDVNEIDDGGDGIADVRSVIMSDADSHQIDDVG